MLSASMRDMESATDQDALWNIAISALDSEGVRCVSYLTVAHDYTHTVLRTTMPELYAGFDPATDPFLHHCCTNYEITRTGAAFLQDYPYLPASAQTFISRAKQVGFHSGLGIPVRLVGSERFGGFNLGTSLDRTAFEQEILPRAEQFRLFALIFHRRAEELAQPPAAQSAALDVPSSPALMDLSPREKEIIWLMAKGLSRKEIAHSCNLSPHTVAEYSQAAYRKLGVKNRVEATRKALGL